MTLESKHRVGDKVYELSNGRITYVMLTKIELTKDIYNIDNFINGEIKFRNFISINAYNVKNQMGYGSVKEKDLFLTKEDAAREMLKRAGMDCGIIEVK